MAKVKKGKGGKKGKKKKDNEIADATLLTEVDKTFYELQITDLNRKLARLRSLTQELELKNEELEGNFKILDDDRADIIMYLKRTLIEKSDEISDLQERLKGLQDVRQTETEDFQTQITDLKEEYRVMQEQLTSEIKLLNGKLNSLEEFRIQRDDLMNKYEIQEAKMEEQEVLHKKIIYEIEKKYIISKDRLKKEMEERLVQLSNDFQDATNLRIAATTHRVIRENIAINNELDIILETQDRLHNENEDLRIRDVQFRLSTELHQAEKNKALAKAQVQYKLIERLTKEHETLTKKLQEYKDIEMKLVRQNEELVACQGNVKNLSYKIRILEQNIHASRCDRITLTTDLEYANEEVERLSDILIEAVVAVEEALKLKPTSDIAISLSKRENLLVNLLQLMSKVHDDQSRKTSIDSVQSLSAMYVKGDLGFVPCPVQMRSKFPTKRNIDCQVGTSLENMATGGSDLLLSEKKDIEDEEEQSLSSEESRHSIKELNYDIVEVVSRVVFDDEPEAISDDSEHAQEIDLLDLVNSEAADIDRALREDATGLETEKVDEEVQEEESEAVATPSVTAPVLMVEQDSDTLTHDTTDLSEL